MRITARIDDVYEQKFKSIQQATHLNTTDIIKQALDLLYAKTGKAALTAKEKNQKLLDELAGTATGPEDLSGDYKDYLYHHLKEKYDIS